VSARLRGRGPPPSASAGESTRASAASSSRAQRLRPGAAVALTAAIRVRPTSSSRRPEGGDVTRLEAAHGSSVPGALRLARSPTRRSRKRAARRAVALREAGVTRPRPAADVNTNPCNPVVGVRASAATRPRRAASPRPSRPPAGRCRGLREALPGHGAAAVDRTSASPVIEATRELYAVELAPSSRPSRPERCRR
jgi:beta-N-acetylhexosaminidase